MLLVSCNLACTYCLVHIRMQLLCFLFEGALDQFISCRGLHTKNFVWVFDGSASSARSMCTSMKPFRPQSTSSQLCHCQTLSTGQVPAPLTTTSCRVLSTLTLILAITNNQATYLYDISLLLLSLCAPCLAVHGMLACKAKFPNIRTPGQVQSDNTNSTQSSDCRLSTAPNKFAMIAAAPAYQRVKHLSPTLTSRMRRFISCLPMQPMFTRCNI